MKKFVRTDLCFAAIGSVPGGHVTNNGTGMGFTCVPCENLKNVEVIGRE